MATTEQVPPNALLTASQSRNPLLLVLVVLALLNMGANGWLVYSQSHSVVHQEATASPVEALPAEQSSPVHVEETTLAALDPFIANLADPSGKRYLRVTFEIEVSPPLVVEEMIKKTAQVRDSMLLVLTSKSYEEIRTTAGKGALRDEIVAELNNILTSGKARQVFFKEFIVQ